MQMKWVSPAFAKGEFAVGYLRDASVQGCRKGIVGAEPPAIRMQSLPSGYRVGRKFRSTDGCPALSVLIFDSTEYALGAFAHFVESAEYALGASAVSVELTEYPIGSSPHVVKLTEYAIGAFGHSVESPEYQLGAREDSVESTECPIGASPNIFKSPTSTFLVFPGKFGAPASIARLEPETGALAAVAESVPPANSSPAQASPTP
jgi:hypothetical protein